ncbi:MAG: glycosyltransferase family 39 protein [Anaerolineae bacterium]|nr:glycosyltransferase family 39 protein [Anaerolineae bacterium]
MKQASTLKVAILVFFAAILISIIFWVALPVRFEIATSTDFDNYYRSVAMALLNGEGFTTHDQYPAIRYTPGYPLILAGVFGTANFLGIPEQIALSIFILLGSGLAAVLIFLLASSIWEPCPALIAAALWTTYPFALIVFRQATAALPFIIAFYGALLLFWTHIRRQSRSGWAYLVVGLLIGIATLIRPVAIWIGLLFATILIASLCKVPFSRRLLLAGLLIAANLITILPWQMWVTTQTNESVLLTTGGVPSIRDGLTFAAADKDRADVAVPPDVLILQQSILDQYADLHSFGDVIHTMWGHLKTEPLAVIELFVIKAARSWYGTDSQQYDRWILLVQIPYLIAIGWGLIATLRHNQPARWLGSIILLIGLYFWEMTILVLSILRYMIPAIGLLFILVPAIFYKPVGQNVEANHAG